MIPDSTDESKAIRRKLAAQFDNDVSRIGADIRRQHLEPVQSLTLLIQAFSILYFLL